MASGSGTGSGSNRVFKALYGQIQADLYNLHLSAEEKILYMYQDAYEEIVGELAKIYANYAVDGKLSFSEMSKYNRLKNLEKQVGDSLLPQLKKKDKYLGDYLSMMYEESYYRHGYAIDQNGGCALKWGLLRKEDLESIANSPLSKLSDSAFLKGDRDQAVFAVRKVISLGIVQGKSYPKMKSAILDAFGFELTKSGRYKSTEKGLYYKSMRIARTEGQRAVVEGQQKAYDKAKDEGVDLIEVWDAALDGRTRPEHGALDGQKMQDKGWYVTKLQQWVKAPLQSGVASFDIHCRCRIRAEIEGYPPLVRGVKGEGQQPWTDYETWKKSVQEKGSAKSVKPAKPKVDTSLYDHIPENMRETAIKAFTDPRIPDDARRVIEKHIGNVGFKYNEHSGTFYRSGHNFINISKGAFKEERIPTTLRHEFGHALDYGAKERSYIAFSASGDFIEKAKAGNRSIGRSQKALAHRKEIYDYVQTYKNDPSLSDFFCSMTKCDIMGRYGHSASYYGDYSRRTVEMFANMFDLYCRQEHWDFLEENFPDLVKQFTLILKELDA